MEYKIDLVELRLSRKFNIETSVNYIYGVEEAGIVFSQQIGDLNVENVGLICLDSTNKIINYSNVSKGSIESVKVKLAEIFKVALLSNASKIIVAHNHPSGVLLVTEEDVLMTKNIGAIASLFDMQLIDSIIVCGNQQAVSIREYMAKEQNN